MQGGETPKPWSRPERSWRGEVGDGKFSTTSFRFHPCLLPFWEEHCISIQILCFHTDHPFSRNLSIIVQSLSFQNTRPALQSTLSGLLEAGPSKSWAENSLRGKRKAGSGISKVQEPAWAQVNTWFSKIQHGKLRLNKITSVSNEIQFQIVQIFVKLIQEWRTGFGIFHVKWSSPNMTYLHEAIW